MAARLALLVALAGVVPLVGLGAIALGVLRDRSVGAAAETLRLVSQQAAGRVGGYVAAQRELLRTLAGVAGVGPEADRRLDEAVLDAPSLAQVRRVDPGSPAEDWPATLRGRGAELARGAEVASEIYVGDDNTPTMDVCVPAHGRAGHGVCARLDLLELWRFVQRIRVGESGYALAFDREGRIIASGAGALRGAVLTGEPVPQREAARKASRDPAGAPRRYAGPLGEEVLAAWAVVPGTGWTVVVEQPEREALGPARAAQWALLVVSALALGLSLAVGVGQSRRMLAALEVDERWKTAGRIAAGVTHDLGHRLTVLQQTAGLAEANDPSFLPRIGENLRTEVATLRKFVADFADLSRDVKAIDMMPLDLDAFAESVGRTAAPHAQRNGVMLEVHRSAGGAWVRADRYLLERAALNLVSNAVEASKPGEPVRIEVSADDAEATLAVVDRGAGIAAERLPHLFDAFASTKRTGAHIGMGLPNVKRIVEAHGARVAVESRPGQGSTFRIAMPRTAAPAEARSA
jgi:signal transduction histidine kinase